MKLIFIACVLIFVGGSFAQEDEKKSQAADVERSQEIEEESEEKDEPVVGVKKDKPMDYYRSPYQPAEYYQPPPPCAKSFMFSCQPIVRAVGCNQAATHGPYGHASRGPASYGASPYGVSPYKAAPLRAPLPPQYTKRLQRCSMPHQISFNPIFRELY